MHTPWTIAVGSKSPIKLRAVTVALERIRKHMLDAGKSFDFTLIPTDIQSVVASQPFEYYQIIKGAEHRAKASCLAHDHATHGIGIESGLVLVDAAQTYFDPPCIMIYERSSEHFYPAFGAFFPIPDGIVRGIRSKGSELGYEVQNRAQGGEKDPHKWFSDGLVSRDEVVEQAILCAMSPLLYPERNQ